MVHGRYDLSGDEDINYINEFFHSITKQEKSIDDAVKLYQLLKAVEYRKKEVESVSDSYVVLRTGNNKRVIVPREEIPKTYDSNNVKILKKSIQDRIHKYFDDHKDDDDDKE